MYGMINPTSFEVEDHAFIFDGATLVKVEQNGSQLLLNGWLGVDDSEANRRTIKNLGILIKPTFRFPLEPV